MNPSAPTPRGDLLTRELQMLRVLVLQTIASRRGFVVPDDLLARAAEEGYEAVWDQIREHNLGMRGLLRRSWGLRRR